MAPASQQKRAPVATSVLVQGLPTPFLLQGQGGSVQEELDTFRATSFYGFINCGAFVAK